VIGVFCLANVIRDTSVELPVRLMIIKLTAAASHQSKRHRFDMNDDRPVPPHLPFVFNVLDRSDPVARPTRWVELRGMGDTAAASTAINYIISKLSSAKSAILFRDALWDAFSSTKELSGAVRPVPSRPSPSQPGSSRSVARTFTKSSLQSIMINQLNHPGTSRKHNAE